MSRRRTPAQMGRDLATTAFHLHQLLLELEGQRPWFAPPKRITARLQ